MLERIKWIERKFNFDLPIGMFPYIIERLRGTLSITRELINGLPDELLKTKINNSWSIKEHFGHLIDLEEIHEIRINQIIAGEKTLIAADISNKKTYEANHNVKEIELLISDLKEVRSKFVKNLEHLDDKIISRGALHPRLNQQMRIIDLSYFVAEHDNHHLTIMREIKNKLLAG